MANKYSKQANERAAQRIKKTLRIANGVCAAVSGIILLFFLCDFFRLSIDGSVDNRISGFKMSFLLFGNALNDKNNILSVFNKSNSGVIKFASAASLLCLVCLIAMLTVTVYGAVKRKPVLSKSVIILCAVFFIMSIMQTAACGSLASGVKRYFYAGCPTCLVQSYSYITLILSGVFMIGYLTAAYGIYHAYGIGFNLTQTTVRNKNKAVRK